MLIIQHEIGHDVSRYTFSDKESQEKVLSALEPFKFRGSGVNAQYENFAGFSGRPEEFIADIYAVAMTSKKTPYEDAAGIYGVAYKAVLDVAKKHKMPLPDWYSP
jgi:hypothetical protein